MKTRLSKLACFVAISAILGCFAVQVVQLARAQTAPGTCSVSFVWDPSTDPDVVGYRLYYGGFTRNYTNHVEVPGAVTNGTVSGLFQGKTYFFAATAVDSLALESDYSNEVVYTCPTNAGPRPSVIHGPRGPPIKARQVEQLEDDDW